MVTTEAKSSTTTQSLQAKAEETTGPFFEKDGGNTVINNDAKGSHFFDTRPAANNKPQPFFSSRPLVQTKLTIGQPGDKYEKEADSMADKVVQRLVENNDSKDQQVLKKSAGIQRKPIFESESEPTIQTKPLQSNSLNTTIIQPKCAECEEEEKLQKKEESGEEEQLQMKPIFESAAPPPDEDTVQRACAACDAEKEKLQTKSAGTDAPVASSNIESRLQSSKGSGSSLPENTRSQMEGAFGSDFSGVRVHTDSSAVQMNKDLGAQAFTHGSDLYFNTGKYDTGSKDGQRLLGHELTHVVQQGGAVSSNINKKTIGLIQRQENENKTQNNQTLPNPPPNIGVNSLPPEESAQRSNHNQEQSSNLNSSKEEQQALDLTLQDQSQANVEEGANKTAEINEKVDVAIMDKASTPDAVKTLSKNAPVNKKRSKNASPALQENQNRSSSASYSGTYGTNPSTQFEESFGKILNASPESEGPLSDLRRELASNQAVLIDRANVKHQQIIEEAEAVRQSVNENVSSFETQIELMINTNISTVELHIDNQITAIENNLSYQIALLRTAMRRESNRLNTEGRSMSSEVLAAATTKESEARELGENEANRANEGANRQAQQARDMGFQNAESFTDSDRERLESRQNAARRVAEEQAREITATGPELGRGARELANAITEGFSGQAQEVSRSILNGIPRLQGGITEMGSSAENQLNGMARTAREGLLQVKQTVVQELLIIKTAAIDQARAIPKQIIPKINDLETLHRNQVDDLMDQSLGALEVSVISSAIALVDNTEGRENIINSSDTRARSNQDTLTQLDNITDRFGEEKNAIIEEVQDNLIELELDVSDAATRLETTTVQQATTEANRTIQGITNAVTETDRGATETVTGALAGYRTEVDNTVNEFQTNFDKGRREVEALVTEGLTENERALANLNGAMDEAARVAAAEYDKPGWQMFLEALVKAVVFLALALIVILILAVLIFAAALILAKLGIIAAISFATAFFIAAVVVAIGFVLLEFYERVVAYLAEHGSIDSFWEALGVSFSLLGLSILNLTGIVSIIEGIRGRRFFSDIELTDQEQYDLVVGGVLQLILIFVGVRSKLKGRTGGARTGRRGFIDRFFEGIERKIERAVERYFPDRTEPRGCFVAGTLVSTRNGLIAIEQIQIGDIVRSYDLERRSKHWASISKTFKFESREIIEIRIEGECFSTTAEHPFWIIGKGWIKAETLEAGDQLITKDQQAKTILSVDQYKTIEEVFNIEVAETHAYFIGKAGILVHNKAQMRPPMERLNEQIARGEEAARGLEEGSEARTEIEAAVRRLENVRSKFRRGKMDEDGLSSEIVRATRRIDRALEGEQTGGGTNEESNPLPPSEINPAGTEYKEPIPGLSGKEGAKEIPSWVRNEGYPRPRVGESGNVYADRIMDHRYGRGNYERGPDTEHNQIRKWADRNFRDPE